MEKNHDSWPFFKEWLKKTLFLMRLTWLFCLLCFVHVSAAVYSQAGRVSLSVSGVTVKESLRILGQEFKKDFFYSSVQFDTKRLVDLRLDDATIGEALQQVFPGKSVDYSVDGDFVVILKIADPAAPVKSTEISGVVRDENDQPLPGVTILIKNTTLGFTTDAQGAFKAVLPMPLPVTLVFTSVGYVRQERTVKEKSEFPLTVRMVPEVTEMEEVVVTGYQIIDKRKLTSAVTSVKASDLMIPSATSIDQMLEGRIPDLMLTVNSGEVGVVPRLRIRGTSTLIGNREPLWVVDGILVQDPVPLNADVLNDPDYVNRIGNAIAGINPQDIDRLDVLKDAAATALYGAKAANGVIVITTKKGHVGKPVVRYSMTTTYKRRPRYSDRKIDLMDSRERVDLSRDLAAMHYRYSSDASIVGYELLLQQLYNKEISETEFRQEVARIETVNTDWFGLLTEDAFSHQHTLSLSGGSDKARYYTSLGYTRDNDVIKRAKNERYTVAMNVDANLSSWLTASMGINGYINTRNYAQDGNNPIDYAYKRSRTIPAYEEDGSYHFYGRYSATGSGNYQFNIMNELENSSVEQKVNGLSFNTNLRFRFRPWLNAHVTLSYAISDATIEGYQGEKTWYAAGLRRSDYGGELLMKGVSLLPFGGELSEQTQHNHSYTVRAQLNLNKYFGKDERHNINLSLGYEANSSHYTGRNSVNRGYYPDRGKSFTKDIPSDYIYYIQWLTSNVPTLTDNLTNLLAAYGTVSYSYRNLFTVNANTRYDGSNKFGSRSNEKLLPVWSVSGAFNVSEIPALSAEWIDFLSLKASYGYQGNMLDGQTPVMLIRHDALNAYYNHMTSSVASYANPDLRWEKTGSFNAGFELMLWNRRLQLSGDWYLKKTSDAFMDKRISSINGQTSYTVNSGKVTNRGFNISVTAIPVQTKDWRWTFSTSYSRAKNKLQTLPGQEVNELDDFLRGTVLTKDQPVGTFYSYKFAGLNPLDGGPLFDDYEDRIDELKGLGKYDTFTKVLTPSGRREPIVSGNLYNTVQWKRVRVGLNLAYSLGAKTRLFKLYTSHRNDFLVWPEDNVSREFVNRWRKPGDEKHTTIPAFFSQNSPGYYGYNTHYSVGYNYAGQKIADNAWDMYNYSDVRVVSANYLKCSNLSVSYEFPHRWLERIGLSRLEATFSGTNLFVLCHRDLKGQTPTQGGFTEVQLSERPTFSFGLNVEF